jgi:hypothetical protein
MIAPQSTLSVPAAPIRWGAWLIPVAGIVPTIVFTLWMVGKNPNPDTDPKGAADAATGALGLGGGIVYILATIALLFGLFALYGCLASGRTGTAALAGLVLSVLSVGLLLAGLGAFVLGSAVAADVYRSGDAGASGVVAKLSGGSFGRAVLVAFIAAIVLGLAGAVAFGAAIWRSGTLPRWSGVLYALGFGLLVGSAPIVSQLGGILLLVGGGWIARTLGRAGATRTRSAPTVSSI